MNEKCENLLTYIYIYDKKTGKTLLKEEKTKEETQFKTDDFLSLYTRMEAIGKTFGLGVSFLNQREKYLPRVKLQSFLFENFVISLAWKNEI